MKIELLERLYFLFPLVLLFSGPLAEAEHYSNRTQIRDLMAEYCPVRWESSNVPPSEYHLYSSDPFFEPKTGTIYQSRVACWGDLSLYEAGSLKYAMSLALAEIFEFYSDYDYYFVGEAEILYDFAQASVEQVAKRDPEQGEKEKKRIHFLPYSSELLGNSYFEEYLVQNGITERALRQGKKVLFIDLDQQTSASEMFNYIFSKKGNTRLHEYPLSRLYESQFEVMSLNRSFNTTSPTLYSRAFHAFLEYKRGVDKNQISNFLMLLPLLPRVLESPIALDETRNNFWDVRSDHVDAHVAVQNTTLALARMRDIKKFVEETEGKFIYPLRKQLREARSAFLSRDDARLRTHLWRVFDGNWYVRSAVEFDLKTSMISQIRKRAERSFFNKHPSQNDCLVRKYFN